MSLFDLRLPLHGRRSLPGLGLVLENMKTCWPSSNQQATGSRPKHLLNVEANSCIYSRDLPSGQRRKGQIPKKAVLMGKCRQTSSPSGNASGCKLVGIGQVKRHSRGRDLSLAERAHWAAVVLVDYSPQHVLRTYTCACVELGCCEAGKHPADWSGVALYGWVSRLFLMALAKDSVERPHCLTFFSCLTTSCS